MSIGALVFLSWGLFVLTLCALVRGGAQADKEVKNEHYAPAGAGSEA